MSATALRALAGLIVRATDEEYPLIVHLPHSIISIARYRRWRYQECISSSWLYDLFLSFYSHSQGGGCGGKMFLEGKSIFSYMCRWDLTHYHVLAYLLAYWSPGDVVYKAVSQPRNPARLACVAMDAMDGVTTLCSLVDAAARIHPRNRLLPAAVGVILYNTGAAFRWLDERARGIASKPHFLTEPGSAAVRGATLATLYLVFGRRARDARSRNRALVAISTAEVVLEVLEDAWGFDAFEALRRRLAVFEDAAQSLAKACRLGVPPGSELDKAVGPESPSRRARS